MQQSSATPSLHLDFWGLRKIVACSQSSSQCLLVPTVFGTVSSLHPISFLMIFILVAIYINRASCTTRWARSRSPNYVVCSGHLKHTKDRSRSKITPFHAKSIVYRPFYLAVGRLY